MKILIDTNIILDVLIKREPFYADSARVWTLIRERTIAGYLSAISINNLYYIVKKLKGCDFLVTRNKKDFPSIGMKIISPRELLKRLEKLNRPKTDG